MAQNTKQDIIACARRLFEARGYNQVSMREIAGELGISVGNLTYHFKKKEDLIEALLLDANHTRTPPPPPETLADLWAYARHLLEVQQTFAFYFDSYHQLAQTSPALARVQQNMLRETSDHLTHCFRALTQQGVLRPEAYPGQQDALIRTITLLLMVRLPGQERRTTGETGIQQVLEGLKALLYPLLIEKKAALHSAAPPSNQ